MAQGRGSGAIMLLFCMLVLCSEMVHADIYEVGDYAGWTFNVTNWTYGKSFKAGDILAFYYSPAFHDVVIVDEVGYNTCRAGAGSIAYESGHDEIKLGTGPSYFICTFPGHCQGGVKIAVNVSC